MTNNLMWSLIVCTYNGGHRLIECLENIALLEGINDSEVIVVDNHSNDGTIALLANFNLAEKIRKFRVVTEKQRGLSFARIRGCREAEGRFLLFIDDDNFPARNFLNVASRIFGYDAKIGLVGGRSCLPSNCSIKSFYRPFLRSFAVGEQHENEGIISGSAYLWGACLCVRREALESYLASYGGFVLLDRVGGSTLSGGDGELVISLRLMGWSAYYSNELMFVHAIAKNRVSVKYLIRLYRSFGMIVRPFNVLQCAAETKFGGGGATISTRLRRKMRDMGKVTIFELPIAVCLFVFLNLVLKYYSILGAVTLKKEIELLNIRTTAIRRAGPSPMSLG